MKRNNPGSGWTPVSNTIGGILGGIILAFVLAAFAIGGLVTLAIVHFFK